MRNSTVPSIWVVQGFGDARRIRRSLDVEGRGADGGAQCLGRRLCFSRVAKGIQKTQGGHGSRRGQVTRYLDVYAGKLEEFTRAGDMRGAATGISRAGGGCRVRRWEARSTSRTMTQSSYRSLKTSVRSRGDIPLPCSTRRRPLSIEQSLRVYRPCR